MQKIKFFDSSIPYSIWITEVDGKTTTANMLQYLLKERGSQVGADEKTPLANLDSDASIWILQQEKPNIYIVLPMQSDDFHSQEELDTYEKNALKPLSLMLEGEAIILPRKYADIPSAGFKILYNNAYDLVKYFDFDIEEIKLQDSFLLYGVIAMGIDKILFDNVEYEKINRFV